MGQWFVIEAEQLGGYAARLIWLQAERRYATMRFGRYAAGLIWLCAEVYEGRYNAMKLGRYAARDWLWENVADVREVQSCGIRPKVEPIDCRLSSK